MQLLPHSLTAIRVFDAVARHASCSRAADELFLTQSAVSKQLQSLEDYLGVKLFTRMHQGVALTDPGAEYWRAVKPALTILADATVRARMQKNDDATIHLGLPATFGQKWLIQRVAEFTRLHPDITVQFAPKQTTASAPAAFSAEIRAGRGVWEGMHSHYLMGRELFAVCSPAVASAIDTRTAEQLLKYRLLEHVRFPQMWDRWFAARRVSAYEGRNAQRYEQFSVMISALSAGMGIGLMPRCLIEQELAEGTLTALFEEPLKTEYGYYLTYRKDQYPSAALKRFSEWLLQLCAASE